LFRRIGKAAEKAGPRWREVDWPQPPTALRNTSGIIKDIYVHEMVFFFFFFISNFQKYD